jgi:hypothetical protein
MAIDPFRLTLAELEPVFAPDPFSVRRSNWPPAARSIRASLALNTER